MADPNLGEGDPTVDDEQHRKSVRASWDWSSPTDIHFSDQVVVTIRDDYILFTFGQVEQPQFQAGDEDFAYEFLASGRVPIRMQFRTAVPGAQFKEVLGSLIKVAKRRGILLEEEETGVVSNT